MHRPRQWHYKAVATYTGSRAGRGTDQHTGMVYVDNEADAIHEAYEDAWDGYFRHIYCAHSDDGFFEKEVSITVWLAARVAAPGNSP